MSEGVITVPEAQDSETVKEPLVSVGEVADGEQITVEFVVIRTSDGAPVVTTQNFTLTCHVNAGVGTCD